MVLDSVVPSSDCLETCLLGTVNSIYYHVCGIETMRYSIVFYYIVLIIAQKYMLFHILVMKNIVISLKGFKVELFVTD